MADQLYAIRESRTEPTRAWRKDHAQMALIDFDEVDLGACFDEDGIREALAVHVRIQPPQTTYTRYLQSSGQLVIKVMGIR